MERTAPAKLKQDSDVNQRIHVLASELVGRFHLLSKLGNQYNGNRDLYQALGYKRILTFDDYYAQYERQDVAKAIIDRPVKATWQGPLELIESNEPEDTEFEKEWKDLDKRLGLKSRLARVDRLTGIGEYGVLLLGFDDARNLEAWSRPAVNPRKLVYVKPFSEKTATILTYEEKQNERYGYPLFYEIEVADPAMKSSKRVKIHYSRIIHITDGTLESEILGTPRLQPVFNRLMDIEKIAGGDAEMFWRGARPGYSGVVDKDYTMTPGTKKDLQDQIDEFEHNLRRILINEGVDLKSLDQQIADPSSHMDTQLKLISSETGIPVRILTGSERGELASSEDRGEWLTYIQSRREEHAEPRILRPFVDRLIELKVLPTPINNDYNVKWADLFSISEKSRVEIGKSRANALREYTSNPAAEAVIPPTVFMMKFLGLTSDEVELVGKIREEEMDEEVRLMAKVKQILNPPQDDGLTGPRKGAGNDKPKMVRGEPRKVTRPAI